MPERAAVACMTCCYTEGKKGDYIKACLSIYKPSQWVLSHRENPHVQQSAEYQTTFPLAVSHLTVALMSFMITNVLKSFLKDNFVIFKYCTFQQSNPGLAHHARTRTLPLSSDTGAFHILKQL